jgi:hypothetical protein
MFHNLPMVVIFLEENCNSAAPGHHHFFHVLIRWPSPTWCFVRIDMQGAKEQFARTKKLDNTFIKLCYC